MKRIVLLTVAVAVWTLAGCPGTQDSGQVNPFLTLTERGFFSTDTSDITTPGGGTGDDAEAVFRQDMQVQFVNLSTRYDLSFRYVAWVLPSSVSTTDEEEALINGNYVRLDQQLQLGSVFTLPEGTYIYNGPGFAGATRVLVPASIAAATDPDDTDQDVTATLNEVVIRLITPDALLIFDDPPVGCDSIAFEYSEDGRVVTDDPLIGGSTGVYEGATLGGGYKTLAQVDVYQCSPFRPGMFLRIGGGAPAANEFFEGQDLAFGFSAIPDDDGICCEVVSSDQATFSFQTTDPNTTDDDDDGTPATDTDTGIDTVTQ